MGETGLILTYDQFKNSANKVYRSTSPQFIISWIKNGKLERPGRFFSFSWNASSGGQDNFGPCRMTLDLNELKKHNEVIEIHYDEVFFAQHPNICMYVTGYRSEEDYYDQMSGRDEVEVLDWETCLEDFNAEEELVVPETLVYSEGVITDVRCTDEVPDSVKSELALTFLA